MGSQATGLVSTDPDVAIKNTQKGFTEQVHDGSCETWPTIYLLIFFVTLPRNEEQRKSFQVVKGLTRGQRRVFFLDILVSDNRHKAAVTDGVIIL